MRKGSRHSSKSLDKMSSSHYAMSIETREKMRLSHLGKKLSEEQKIKIGNSGRGRKLSEEAKKRISLAAKRRTGSKNNRWKGGRFVDSKGHIIIPWHGRRRAEHRVIWETYYGYALTKEDIVHHKNGNPSDNRIENLELMTNSQHTAHHKLGSRHSEESKLKMSAAKKGKVC